MFYFQQNCGDLSRHVVSIWDCLPSCQRYLISWFNLTSILTYFPDDKQWLHIYQIAYSAIFMPRTALKLPITTSHSIQQCYMNTDEVYILLIKWYLVLMQNFLGMIVIIPPLCIDYWRIVIKHILMYIYCPTPHNYCQATNNSFLCYIWLHAICAPIDQHLMEVPQWITQRQHIWQIGWHVAWETGDRGRLV